MDTVIRYFAVIKAARGVPGYVTQCKSIVGRMALVPKYQGALLTQATADVEALDLAEQAARKGSPAETKDRNAKLRAVRVDMHQIKAIVQGNADADFVNAQTIIESSGMSVRKRTITIKPDFAAKQGKVPTTAGLFARAVKTRRVSYMWQMSADMKVWVDLPQTVKSSTIVTGLTPATVYYFRYRTLTPAGLSDWSMVASLIAH